MPSLTPVRAMDSRQCSSWVWSVGRGGGGQLDHDVHGKEWPWAGWWDSID